MKTKTYLYYLKKELKKRNVELETYNRLVRIHIQLDREYYKDVFTKLKSIPYNA